MAFQSASGWSWILSVIFLGGVRSWEHSSRLSEDVHLGWTANLYEDITFELAARTEGYLALGLVPPGKKGGMPEGTDLAIGWINQDGTVELHDYHVTLDHAVRVDSSQDWQLIAGQKNATHTVIQFRRKLQTCDPEDIPITNDTSRVLWAYHQERPANPGEIPYHGTAHRGEVPLLLLQPRLRTRLPTSQLHTWDVTASNISLRHDVDFTYTCSVVRAPKLGKKHHAIKVEPLIPAVSARLARHIILFQCLDVTRDEIEQYQDSQGSCHDSSSPEVFNRCEDIFAIWTQGSEGIQIPDHVGIPLGENEDAFFLLEILYTNPGRQQVTVMDPTGLRVFYTPKLRRHNTAVLAIGSLSEPCMAIPPGRTEYLVAGHAHPQCLAPVLPKDGVKVYGGVLLGHSLTRKLVIRQFREGEEREPILSDENFVPDFLQYRLKFRESKVLPKDHLVLECTYDSTSRVTTTFGGLGSQEERCMAYLLYYPRVPRSQVLSCPSVSLVTSLAGVSALKQPTDIIDTPLGLRGRPWTDYLRTYPWTADFVDAVLQPATRWSPHRAMCNLGDGGNFETPMPVHYPRIKTPYHAGSTCSTPTEGPLLPLATSPAVPLIKDNGPSSIHLPSPTVHIIVAEEEQELVEVSTPDSAGSRFHVGPALLGLLLAVNLCRPSIVSL